MIRKKSKSRDELIHLYNPIKEGLGSYDIHYINAYKKDNDQNNQLNNEGKKRYAAWLN